MMSFSQVKSAGNAGGYYTDKDNYYVLGSMDDHWYGEGAKQLGLSGAVDKAVFTQLLHGRLPDGADLSRLENGVNKHRPGYDLTFSAPKSVSMMAMLGGDRRLIDAHNRAVDVALKQAEALASTRTMRDGVSETVLTGNLIIARFNHDTSRDQDPQLHTHSVVLNATRKGDKWQALSSDTVGKTGFSENILANQIALGKIYRQALRSEVEAMGYQVEVVGKHSLWEMKNVPVEAFSHRSQAIQEAVGPDASLKSRDVATLDTRKAKMAIDPTEKMAEWMATLKSTGFDIQGYREAAAQRVTQGHVPAPAEPAAVDMAKTVRQAISQLSERKVQFTYSDMLAATVSLLPATDGVIARARAGIDHAIEQQQLIPLDREKGVFTSDIHVLDELSVRTLGQSLGEQGHVTVGAMASSASRHDYSPLAQQVMTERPPLAMLASPGGAGVQRHRVSELVQATQALGREVQILVSDAKSQRFLQQDAELGQTAIFPQRVLNDGMAFTPNSTLIVTEGEKLTLKETVTLLDGALRNNVQLLILDTAQRQATGNALSVLRESGIDTLHYAQTAPVETQILSEPDKPSRFARLADDYVAARQAGDPVVAQVSGPTDQQHLTRAIRSAMKTQGALGQNDTALMALEPVWLDSKNRLSRDTYRAGMVMERWDAESKTATRYVIDRVTARSHTLTLRDEQGATQTLRLSSLDSRWSLYQPQTLAVSSGEQLRVLGKMEGLAWRAGDSLQVQQADEAGIQVERQGQMQRLAVGKTPFTAIKVAYGYVEGLGRSVNDKAQVLAAVAHNDLNQGTLNRLARSGSRIRLYSAQAEDKVAARLGRHPAFSTVTTHLKQVAGQAGLEEALTRQRAALHTPAQQALHLAVPVLEREGGSLAFSRVSLLAQAQEVAGGQVPLSVLADTIQTQIREGALISVDSAPGHGNDLLVSRATFEAEKSILRHIAEGKAAVTPLMGNVPESHLAGLTAGQQAATRMILETPDRFTVVQGYAGVGKTTQFRAVMSAIATLPETARPRVVGLGPTHRAVGEMQAAGVEAQTLASFLFDTRQAQQQGEVADFSNTLFLIDESSMLGNSDMASAYALIARGGGRAVASGDTDQLQAIAPGQPFHLQQTRSAADVAIMKEIVRQTPALRPAVYSLIARDVAGALETVERVSPQQVPRQAQAWFPPSSVMEIKKEPDASPDGVDAVSATLSPPVPATLHDAIVADYLGRTPQARDNTLIITHLNQDRRAVNALIHDARVASGELSREERPLPILVSANIPEGALRRLSTWKTHQDTRPLLENTYHRIVDVDEKNQLVTLQDETGRQRVLSPQEAVREGVTLYRSDTITVSVGDRMRFSKSDSERGFVANSTWTISAIEGDSVTLTNGNATRVVHPATDQADRHIDLAYAITAHGAQGASESFAIALEGAAGKRRSMVNHASAYVALSRAKQHVQVYTDNREAWVTAIQKADRGATAHEILQPRGERTADNAARLLAQAVPLSAVAAGRAVLKQDGLDAGTSLARFVAPGRKYPQPHVAFPAFDENGKAAGAWLSPLSQGDKPAAVVLPREGRLFGSTAARFVALQASRNGESRLAAGIEEGVKLAARFPDAGIVVRLQGEGVPWNPGAMTGGHVWADAGETGQGTSGEAARLPPEILALRQSEEAARVALEKQAEKTAREMLGQKEKPSPDDVAPEKMRQIVDEVVKGGAEQVPHPADTLPTLPDHQQSAVEQVAERLQRERLQQMERELVRDKTLAGD
ncbi:conjugative transfer relaxase/helicase TraI (plasmid) [Edwardsiella tarda]|uniref:conjugative transfer relaxase/helicase TraI n=1 Tax=Edwardsiella tarda TaxID=636 RepID=UPI00351C7D28